MSAEHGLLPIPQIFHSTAPLTSSISNHSEPTHSRSSPSINNVSISPTWNTFTSATMSSIPIHPTPITSAVAPTLSRNLCNLLMTLAPSYPLHSSSSVSLSQMFSFFDQSYGFECAVSLPLPLYAVKFTSLQSHTTSVSSSPSSPLTQIPVSPSSTPLSSSPVSPDSLAPLSATASPSAISAAYPHLSVLSSSASFWSTAYFCPLLSSLTLYDQNEQLLFSYSEAQPPHSRYPLPLSLASLSSNSPILSSLLAQPLSFFHPTMSFFSISVQPILVDLHSSERLSGSWLLFFHLQWAKECPIRENFCKAQEITITERAIATFEDDSLSFLSSNQRQAEDRELGITKKERERALSLDHGNVKKKHAIPRRFSQAEIKGEEIRFERQLCSKEEVLSRNFPTETPQLSATCELEDGMNVFTLAEVGRPETVNLQHSQSPSGNSNVIGTDTLQKPHTSHSAWRCPCHRPECLSLSPAPSNHSSLSPVRTDLASLSSTSARTVSPFVSNRADPRMSISSFSLSSIPNPPSPRAFLSLAGFVCHRVDACIWFDQCVTPPIGSASQRPPSSQVSTIRNNATSREVTAAAFTASHQHNFIPPVRVSHVDICDVLSQQLSTDSLVHHDYQFLSRAHRPDFI